MNLSSSLEDYLEAIYDIKNEENIVRITDISAKLNVEKPSVNTAVEKLKNLNLVIHEKYGDIILTKKGEEEASRVKAKHDILLRFLNDILGITRREANRDACKIEHAISNNTFERLSKFIEFLDKSPFFNSEEWQKSFENYIQT
jgi:DtxR family transcriptional regulator, Mn-dependent transcriptional regulator